MMQDKEMERMINAAGLIGAIFGFVSGAGLMALVGIIF
jgi:tetrahydromethanopterin S-methyltransferase subunit B